MQRLGLFLVLLTISSCSSSQDVRPIPAADNLDSRDAVIFVHGYYGSALRESGNGPRRFIRVPTILWGNFAIGLNSEELEIRKSPDLEVEGLIARVPILSGLWANDVYGKFLERLEEKTNRQVIPFSYDWRKNPEIAVRSLEKLVESLTAKGVKKIALVAHSMGGLVAAYYLGYGADPSISAKLSWYGAQKISEVVFLGTPFRGTMSLLRNMHFGTGYPWNEDLLEGNTVASLPASYHLLPLIGEARFKTADGKNHFHSLAQSDFWEQHRIGLLRNEKIARPFYERRLSYVKEQLERAVRFLNQVQLGGNLPNSLKVLNVVGKGRPTLDSGYFDPATSELLMLPSDVKAKGLLFSALESDGDQSVTVASATLPPALEKAAKTVFTDYSHEKLFLDPEVEKEYANFLNGK